MYVAFRQFRIAILDLITLRRSRLDAMPLPDPDLVAALEDLETTYVELVDKTSRAEQESIGEFYREALAVFGSKVELFQQYPDAAGLLLALWTEAGRRYLREHLRFFRKAG